MSDVLELPFSSVVVPDEKMVIVEYALTVYNTDGQIVFMQTDRQSDRRGFFGSMFGGAKPQVSVPESFQWDGRWQLPDQLLPEGAVNGELVSDGEYTYQFTVIDDAGKFSQTPPFYVTVDNTAPEVIDFPSSAYTMFSPNGDGVRDTVALPILTTREVEWSVVIEDSDGREVARRSYVNEERAAREQDGVLPSPIEWDGRDDQSGEILPEGEFRIVVRGADRAGNTVEVVYPYAVVLSLQGADLSVVPTDGVAAFSPNDDQSRDRLPLSLGVSDPDEVVSWRIEVTRSDVVIQSLSGEGVPPAEWIYDGRRADRSLLDDGEVRITLFATLTNGIEVASFPLVVQIDTVAPFAFIAGATLPQATNPGEPFVFGVGEKQEVEAQFVYDREAEWEYRFTRDGQVITTGSFADLLESAQAQSAVVADGIQERATLLWSGEAYGGEGRAEDGLYQFTLSARDEAGNESDVRPLRIVKDERTPQATLSVEGEYISPLSGRDNQQATFRIDYQADEIISQFLFEIYDQEGRMVRSSYQRRGFDTFEWNGLTNGGSVAEDGSYTASLRVLYQNGHIAEAMTDTPVVIDRTPPRITVLGAESLRFSPDGDGENDELFINQEVEPGDQWYGEVVDGEGTLFGRWEWGSEVAPFRWDGRSDDGQLIADGQYRYALVGTDLAGNVTREEILFAVGLPTTDPVSVTMRLTPQPFSPDDDGRQDELTIELTTESLYEIADWELLITSPEGEPFRSMSGEGAPPEEITWDGMSDEGVLVETAREYPIAVTVRDVLGNEKQIEERIAIDILVIKDGDRLRIRVSDILFAPNTADLFLSDERQLSRNIDTLQRLAVILKRYPEHEIVIEGHAAHIYLDGRRVQIEQDEVLIPLSRDRATEVMQALMILGIERSRMSVQAYGGARPVVPHADRDAMWRNRRVDFVLQRPTGAQ